MKSFSKAERLKHVENWESGTLSKAAYAKTAGLHPTTFYTWIRKAPTGKKEFVEIKQNAFNGGSQNVVIEKGNITVHVPLTAGLKELQTILGALGSET